MNQVHTYKFSLISLSGELNLQVSSSNGPGIEQFMNEFQSIFLTEDVQSGEFVMNAFQVYSHEIKMRIDELMLKYRGIHPSINKIPAYFRKLKKDESFVFVPAGVQIDEYQKVTLYNWLRHLEQGVEFKPLQEQTDGLFKEMFKSYDVNSFGDTRVSIGEPEKTKRLCRFCGNKRVPLTFNNTAHAISEGLGNKTVVLFDECDICNSEFSRKTEQDIIQYLSFYRTFFGVKGKDGVKRFSGTNFDVNEDGVAIFSVRGNQWKGEDPLTQLVSMNTDRPVVLQNVYRTLVKYFLSVIDAKYLQHFGATVDWINGDSKIDRLPLIAEMTTYHFFSLQPKLVTYIRTGDERNIPFAVCEFHFTCLVFVFIVPLSGQDDSQYLDGDYKKFWDAFPHFNKSDGWVFKDYSSQRPVKITLQANFERPAQGPPSSHNAC